MWNCHGILRALIIVWVTWDVNSGPLSDWKEVGIPNQGMIWVTIIAATVVALLLEVGKASTHPEKVSTRTRRYLCLFTLGIFVKSTCQSAPGMCPLAW
jgi:hypothetical protein